MLSFLPYSIGHWFGIATEFLIAAAMIAGGLYIFALFKVADTNPLYRLLGPIRYLGLVLVGCGLILAASTEGKRIGAAQCEAAWKAKDLELQIANLKRDIRAKEVAADNAADIARTLAEQKATADAQISDYQTHAASLSAQLVSCRTASADDNRRLCQLVRDAAPGCKPAR